MKLPLLHRFILQRIDKTLDNRMAPGPVLCLLMRLDSDAAQYYCERLTLDDRLSTDLAPFLGYQQNNIPAEATELASNAWSHDRRSSTPWRARVAAACVVILLGLTFAFNFCVVSPYRPAASTNAVAVLPDTDLPEAQTETITTDATTASSKNNDVIDLAVSLLLLPETNMLDETNLLLTQDELYTHSDNHANQHNPTHKEHSSQDALTDEEHPAFVLREVAHSNPLTKYIMDRCIVPVFMSP